MRRIISIGLLAFFLPMFGFVGVHNEDSYYCDTSYFETSGTPTYTEEVINFSSCDSSLVVLDIGCPTYENYNQANSCAPLAGSIILGYYDVFHTNLVPNFEPGQYYNGKFYFKMSSAVMTGVKEKLYDLMGTNTINPGTSVAQFKNGLNSYVNGQGYSINYFDCGWGFNIETAKQYFTQQKPIIMFLNSYQYIDYGGFSEKENKISYLVKKSNNGHVVVAYGYKEYKIYVNGKLSSTQRYLIVSFGDGSDGYLIINSTACIDEAYAISIY